MRKELNDMAYQSGEITVPWMNQQTAPPAVAVFNNVLYVIGGSDADHNGRMTQITFQLGSLVRTGTPPPGSEPIDTEALSNMNNWHSDYMALPPNTTTPCTYARCSNIAMPDAMYLFWNQYMYEGNPPYVLYASRNPGTGWGPPIQLLEEGGAVPGPDYNAFKTDVSATPIGNNKFIYACAQAKSSTNVPGGIYLAIYDIGKIDNNTNTWKADWHTYLSALDMQFWTGASGPTFNPNVTYANNGNNVSIDWFSTVTSGNQLAYYLAISFVPLLPTMQLNQVNGAIIYLPMTVTGDSPNDLSVSITVPSKLACIASYDSQGNTIFASPIQRDTAGRLRVYNLAGGWAGYYNTTQNPIPPTPYLTLTGQVDTFKTSGVSVNPGGFYYTFPVAQPATPVNGFTGTQYAVYEFVFYNSCQVNRFGTLQVFPNYASPQTPILKQQANPVTNVIAGIIDGPIPLPIANYTGYIFGGNDKDAGDIVYGASNTSVTSRNVSNSWTVGFLVSEQFTKGVGPAYDISFDGGMGSVSEKTKETCLSFALTQPSVVNAPSGPSAPPTVNKYGSLRKVSAQFTTPAYRFLDANGNPVTDATAKGPGQSSQLSTILISFIDPGGLSYTPYAVTPGDLTSYTPDLPNGWNATMSKLGYTGSDYYDDIIYANSYVFQQNQPYLAFSWSEESTSGQGFNSLTSSYTEHSWEFNLSAYGGISGGLGFSICDLGEEMEAQYLAGGTYSHEVTADENQQTTWGITLSNSWGPPNTSQDPKAVSSYAFRLHFLPVPVAPSTLPSNYWTQELKDYMPAGSDTSASSIDTSSSCWKIVFVVTSITYKDSTIPPYQYQDNPNAKSVYQKDSATTEKS